MSLYVASQYPIYTPKIRNYQNNVRYEVCVTELNERCHILQKVIGGSSFIYQVLKDKKAEFGITYKIKDSLLRCTYQYPPTEVSDEEIIGEYLIRDIPKGTSFVLMPFIFLLKEKKIHVSKDNTYGLNEIWWESQVAFPKYSKIAHYSPFNFENTYSLFSVHLDVSLKKGQLKIKFHANEPIPFIVACASDIHNFLRTSPADDSLRKAIENEILVGSFAMVRIYYLEDEERELSENLNSLKEHMRKKGLTDWTKDDFNPSEVAAKICPFEIPE